MVAENEQKEGAWGCFLFFQALLMRAVIECYSGPTILNIYESLFRFSFSMRKKMQMTHLSNCEGLFGDQC